VGSTSIIIKQSEEDFKWTTLASEEMIKRTIEALRGRGVRVEFLKKKHYPTERLL
jgi:biotin operon repressor